MNGTYIMDVNGITAWNHRLRKLSLYILFLLVFSNAWSQEINLFIGTMVDSETKDRSYAWQLEYGEEIANHFTCSVSYLNEGHIPDHHRDGDIFQLWIYQKFLDQRISVAGGIGPYYYYDTTIAHNGSSYSNAHGLGYIASLAATWDIENHWLAQLRTNMIHTQDDLDTTVLLIGIGYRFNMTIPVQEYPQRPLESGKILSNEVTILMGGSILNSFDSQNSFSWCAEYRRALLPSIDWTIAYLNEGDNDLVHRHGLNTQLWLIRNVIEDNLWFGIGGGLYVFKENIDEDNSATLSSESTSGIFSMTGTFRFYPSWDARITWNRVISHNNLDSDVILGGVGYRF
jgi:hypothetical protein